MVDEINVRKALGGYFPPTVEEQLFYSDYLAMMSRVEGERAKREMAKVKRKPGGAGTWRN